MFLLISFLHYGPLPYIFIPLECWFLCFLHYMESLRVLRSESFSYESNLLPKGDKNL